MNAGVCFSKRDQHYINQPYYPIIKEIRDAILMDPQLGASASPSKPWMMKLFKQIMKLPRHAMILWPKANMYVPVQYLLLIDYRLRPIFQKLQKHHPVKYSCDGDDQSFDLYFRCDYRNIQMLSRLDVDINWKFAVQNLSDMIACGNMNSIKELLKVDDFCKLVPQALDQLDQILNVQSMMLINHGRHHTEEESVIKQKAIRAGNAKIFNMLFDHVHLDDLDPSLWNVAGQHYELALLECLRKKRLAGKKALPKLDEIDELLRAHLRGIYNEVREHEGKTLLEGKPPQGLKSDGD